MVDWQFMWAIYWKRFPIIQVLFVAICVAMRWGFGRPWQAVGTVLMILELSAVFSAWWAYRLSRLNT